MARSCKLVGTLAVLLGLALATACGVQMARDDEYRRAALVAARNPGNVLYDAEFKGAQVRRAFQLVEGAVGVLLAFNGVTLMVLGAVAARVVRIERPA
jgi:hypothetical protein